MSKLVAQSASFLVNLGTVRCTMLLINSMSLKSVNSIDVRWSLVTQNDLCNFSSNKSLNKLSDVYLIAQMNQSSTVELVLEHIRDSRGNFNFI